MAVIQFFLLCWTLVMLNLQPAQAQVDAASRILLRTNTPTSQPSYDSDRYTVKPSKPKTPVVVDFTKHDKLPPKVEVDEPVKSPVIKTEQNVLLPEATTLQPPALLVPDSTLQAMKDISEEDSWVSKEDPRRNTIEIELLPTFLYNDSKSNYFFNDHQSAAPAFGAGFQVWFSPNWGIKTNYLGSFGASIEANAENSDFIEAEHHFFSAGVRYRKIFGLSKKAKSMSVGLDFDEYKFDVSGQAKARISTKTQGVKISFETSLPDSNQSFYVLGAEFVPSGSRDESSTAISVKSGNDDKTYALGLSVGKKYVLDRKNQFYWKVYHRVENSTYTGTANLNDPETEESPSGVRVLNSTSLLQFGFVWGR